MDDAVQQVLRCSPRYAAYVDHWKRMIEISQSDHLSPAQRDEAKAIEQAAFLTFLTQQP